MNAEPTRTGGRAADPLADAKRSLDEEGFCILPGVLDAQALAAVRQRTEEQAQAEKALGLAPEMEGPNQRVFMLVNKGQVFVDLITHPVAMALATHALGQSFLLSQFSANIARLGGVEQGLHCDDWWAPRPIERGAAYTRVGDLTRFVIKEGAKAPERDLITPCCVVNFAWMITDFTVENGGTRLAPRSHLSGATPDGGVPHKVPTIAAQGKAGDLLVFDGRMWHGTGRNTTPDPRIALLMTYCGPQFRAQENFFVGLDPEVYAKSSERLRELLGFKLWMGYGRGEIRPDRPFVSPQERSYPQLSLKPQ